MCRNFALHGNSCAFVFENHIGADQRLVRQRDCFIVVELRQPNLWLENAGKGKHDSRHALEESMPVNGIPSVILPSVWEHLAVI